ncbi:MAG: hypothetical protein KC619_21245 [Myxococcales bacterium]|nr:hypothetical protein [Myxococcales bacterium]
MARPVVPIVARRLVWLRDESRERRHPAVVLQKLEGADGMWLVVSGTSRSKSEPFVEVDPQSTTHRQLTRCLRWTTYFHRTHVKVADQSCIEGMVCLVGIRLFHDLLELVPADP